MTKRHHLAASLARIARTFGGGLGRAVSTVSVYAGAASISYGAFLFSAPLGFVVGGALLIAGPVAQELAKEPT